ncbi:putative lysophosphatidic acid:oleoyl-CoA acyltransferase [Golovinomyces cichoracearum]|uniref:Putative lysophosphatidic acid:oleoyl-CoA acyltransferase n=1 Tax=Golovinomyces cichoracearum TaxID=62708 RepID=A0A420HK29_9PEZI|nr:putative lysophosphatidic acid:oleoyl-CoA acyltransferase [Golovinomyces cichoracearum]
MEKYSQFRDRGSGIAPFFPIKSRAAGIYLPIHIITFFIKLPFIIFVIACFVLLQCLPLGPLFKKATLWIILGSPGLWWIDLQIDGVRKGSLAKKHVGRVPGPSDVIASSFASPIDALYLAAIFDPIFTVSYPSTEKVQVVSLLVAITKALARPEEFPPENVKLTDIKTLIDNNQQRAIVVFPECTTTNGTGIMPLSPSLLTVPCTTKIFPLNLRYAPADITTPVPGLYFSFIWNLLATPTHSIRVRIAQAVYNNSPTQMQMKDRILLNQPDSKPRNNDQSNIHIISDNYKSQYSQFHSSGGRNVLDTVGEALARLGRVQRVGLTVKDKIKFIEAWKSV